MADRRKESRPFNFPLLETGIGINGFQESSPKNNEGRGDVLIP